MSTGDIELCRETPPTYSRTELQSARGYCQPCFPGKRIAQDQRQTTATARPNMVGAYGPWLSEKVLGDGPARLSFRTGKWKSLDEWRGRRASASGSAWRRSIWAASPRCGSNRRIEFDGLHIERLSWQLPGGPRTEAVFLKPAGAKGPLPGDPRAARSRRQQIPRLAEDRPHR